MKTPHKHTELIKAWADGAEIQCRLVVTNGTNEGHVWVDAPNPSWDFEKIYRIKPEPKPDTVYYCNVYKTHMGHFLMEKAAAIYAGTSSSKGVLSLSFDGETGKLKTVEIVE